MRNQQKRIFKPFTLALDEKHAELWRDLKVKLGYKTDGDFLEYLLGLAAAALRERCEDVLPSSNAEITLLAPIIELKPRKQYQRNRRKCALCKSTHQDRCKTSNGEHPDTKIHEAGLSTTIALTTPLDCSMDKKEELIVDEHIIERDESSLLDILVADSNLPQEEIALKVSEMAEARFDDDELDDVLDLEPSGSLLRAFAETSCHKKSSDLEGFEGAQNDKESSLLDLSQNDIDQGENSNLYESSLILSEMSPQDVKGCEIGSNESEKENYDDNTPADLREDNADPKCAELLDSIPEGFSLQMVEDHGPSLFATSSFPKGETIGPLEGVIIKAMEIEWGNNMRHIWQIGGEEEMEYLSSEKCSNWLKYIRPAPSQAEANCVTRPMNGQVYFQTTRALNAGDELVYWVDDSKSKWAKKKLDRTSCGGCNLHFGHVLYYKLHCTIFHDPSVHLNIRKFYCKICGAPFLGKEKIMKHANEAHDGKGAYQCCHCSKFFLRLRHLELHRQHSCPKNPERTKLKCDLCEKQFSQPSKLKVHKKRMHSESDQVLKEFQCEHCDKVLVTVAGLVRHKKEVHNKDMSASCEQCGKIFQNRSNLKIHMLTHSGVRPFRCEIEECSAGFTTKQRLKAHYLNTHGLQPEQMPQIVRRVEFTFDAYSGAQSSKSPQVDAPEDNLSEGMSPLSVGCSVDLPPLSVPKPDAYSEEESIAEPQTQPKPVPTKASRKFLPLQTYSASFLVDEAICAAERDIIGDNMLTYETLPTYMGSPARDYSASPPLERSSLYANPSPPLDRPILYNAAVSPSTEGPRLVLPRNYTPPYRERDLPGSPLQEHRDLLKTNSLILRDYNISSLIKDDLQEGLIDPGKDPEVAEFRSPREESRDGLAEYRREIYRRDNYLNTAGASTVSEGEVQNLCLKEKTLQLELSYKAYEGLDELGRDTTGLENLLVVDPNTQVVGRSLHLSPRYPPTYDTESMDLSLPRIPYSSSPIYSIELPSRFELPTGRLVDLRSHLGLSPHRFQPTRVTPAGGSSPPPSYLYQPPFGGQHPPPATRHSPTPTYHPYSAYY